MTPDRFGLRAQTPASPGCLPKACVPPSRPQGKRSRRIGSRSWARLGLPQIDRGGLALITAFELEAHPLAFVQVTDTGAFDRRDVYEHIPRSVLRLNEAVAFLGIEPLHGSDSHLSPSQVENSPPLTSEGRGHTATSNGWRSGARSRLGRQAEP